MVNNLTELFNDWKNLLEKVIPDQKQQIQFIAVLEDLLIEEHVELSNYFSVMLQILNSHDFELLSDEAIIEWYKAEESGFSYSDGFKIIEPNKHKQFVERVKPYIETQLLNNK
jgi:hypothetical protein